MNRSDFKAFSAIIVGMAEIYGQSLSPEGIALRFKALSAHPLQEIDKAALTIDHSRSYTSIRTEAGFQERKSGCRTQDTAAAEAVKVL